MCEHEETDLDTEPREFIVLLPDSTIHITAYMMNTDNGVLEFSDANFDTIIAFGVGEWVAAFAADGVNAQQIMAGFANL